MAIMLDNGGRAQYHLPSTHRDADGGCDWPKEEDKRGHRAGKRWQSGSKRFNAG